MIYSLGKRRMHTDGEDWYVAPSADVIGLVRLGRGASVWFGAVLRGDSDWIEIGDASNVQDGSIMHSDPGIVVRIGARVSIGHGALLHACEVGDCSLIGNRAIVLDGARIGQHCMIGAGALIPPGREIPDGMVVMGSPGRVVREVTPDEMARIARTSAIYLERGREYRRALESDPRTARVDGEAG